VTRARPGGFVKLAALLQETYARSPLASVAPIALYLVRLSDALGLALALAVHASSGGPDPAVLRQRAEQSGITDPLTVLAVPIDAITRALDALSGLDDVERRLVVWTVRELHMAGEVPIVMVMDGPVTVTSLSSMTPSSDDGEPFAWSLPAAGEA
jgi:hypothetical protein